MTTGVFLLVLDVLFYHRFIEPHGANTISAWPELVRTKFLSFFRGRGWSESHSCLSKTPPRWRC